MQGFSEPTNIRAMTRVRGALLLNLPTEEGGRFSASNHFHPGSHVTGQEFGISKLRNGISTPDGPGKRARENLEKKAVSHDRR